MNKRRFDSLFVQPTFDELSRKSADPTRYQRCVAQLLQRPRDVAAFSPRQREYLLRTVNLVDTKRADDCRLVNRCVCRHTQNHDFALPAAPKKRIRSRTASVMASRPGARYLRGSTILESSRAVR